MWADAGRASSEILTARMARLRRHHQEKNRYEADFSFAP
jgi:hypothetical protein